MQIKKIFLIGFSGIIVISSITFFVFRSKDVKVTEVHFTDSSLEDEIVVVGEKFELEKGQSAIVGNAGITIKYSGIIVSDETNPPIESPVYDFVYGGIPVSYTTSPYNVSVVFGSNGNNTVVVNVASVESECESGTTEEKDQCWLDLANRTSDKSYCSNIISQIKKEDCINYEILEVARNTFYETKAVVSNPVVNPSDVIQAVRNECQGTSFSSGMCKIVGEESVLTPQQCLDLIPGGEYSEDFLSDCFEVSMYVYGPDADICYLANPDTLIESCLVSAEEAKT